MSARSELVFSYRYADCECRIMIRATDGRSVLSFIVGEPGTDPDGIQDLAGPEGVHMAIASSLKSIYDDVNRGEPVAIVRALPGEIGASLKHGAY
jgi:hypothetical protein